MHLSFIIIATIPFLAVKGDCPVEVTTNCSNIANITWSETEIGDEVSVRCPCGPEDENPLPPQSVATRRCGGDNVTGARWEDPVCTKCQFSDNRLTLCALLQVDDSAQVAAVLANVSEEAYNLQSEDVVLVSILLEHVANSTEVQENPEVLEDFLKTVDNIAEIDEAVLRSSNKETGSANRITESLDRVVDAIPLPENNSGNASIVLTFNNFAIQIQQLPRDNTSFTPNLTQLIMGIGDMNTTTLRENVNTTGSVTLPPELTSFQSVSFAVFLRTSLYPPSNVNSSVESIIISVSIPNQIVDNLREPVTFTFQKNKVVRNTKANSNLTCKFWDKNKNGGKGDWSTRGCVSVYDNEDGENITCQCDHLTSFSILLDILPDIPNQPEPVPNDAILTVVSYIGSGLFVIALVIALVTYLAERKLRKYLHQKLLISLMFALLGLYVAFIITNAVSSNPANLRTIPVVCGILSALLHYFFLVTFLCMAAIAISYHRELQIIFTDTDIQSYLPIAVSISWIVPFFIVGFSVAPNYKYFTGEFVPYCRPQSWPFYFGLVVPLGLIYIFNITMIVITAAKMIQRPSLQNEIEDSATIEMCKRFKKTFWTTVGLTILVGVSWVFGLLATAGLPNYIQFPCDIVFTVLASFLGVLIFVLYCLRFQECRQLWKSWLFCRFTKNLQSKTSASRRGPRRIKSISEMSSPSGQTSMLATLNRYIFHPSQRKNVRTLSSAEFSFSVRSPEIQKNFLFKESPTEFIEMDVNATVEHSQDDFAERMNYPDHTSGNRYHFDLETVSEIPSKEGIIIVNKDADMSDDEKGEGINFKFES